MSIVFSLQIIIFSVAKNPEKIFVITEAAKKTNRGWGDGDMSH
jgi:hypothetical protein